MHLLDWFAASNVSVFEFWTVLVLVHSGKRKEESGTYNYVK